MILGLFTCWMVWELIIWFACTGALAANYDTPSFTLTFVILTGAGFSIEIGSSLLFLDIWPTTLFCFTSELNLAYCFWSGVLSTAKTDAGSMLFLLSISAIFSGSGLSGDMLLPGFVFSTSFVTIWRLLWPMIMLSTLYLPLSAVVSWEDRGFGVLGLICDVRLVFGWKNSCESTWLGLGLFFGL